MCGDPCFFFSPCHFPRKNMLISILYMRNLWHRSAASNGENCQHYNTMCLFTLMELHDDVLCSKRWDEIHRNSRSNANECKRHVALFAPAVSVTLLWAAVIRLTAKTVFLENNGEHAWLLRLLWQNTGSFTNKRKLFFQDNVL